MFKLVLLFLTLSGLQAAPVPDTRGAQKAAFYQLPNGFQHSGIPEAVLDDVRQGIEPSRRFLVDHNTGRMQEHISEMDRRAGFIQPSFENGLEEIDRRYWLTDEVPVDVPAQKNGGGWVRVEEPSAPYLPDGFRQGTERSMAIPDGFRQGTERFMAIPDGFRQGTERFMAIPDGFRQGTEPFMSIPDGFRQGTEPSTSRLQTQTVACKGDIINGNCYEFNPMLLSFQEAQASCRALATNADLASVTSGNLHSRLVSLATNGGKSSPKLTWLGGTVKNQQASWVDGSEWSYSDWKPGHPNIHTDKPVCVEMFMKDASWWTAADCELKKASICSYPIAL
ncbi:hypothetical protein PAMA_014431 [Pampus argenteus]